MIDGQGSETQDAPAPARPRGLVIDRSPRDHGELVAFVAHYGALVARTTAACDQESLAPRAVEASRGDPALARMLPVFLWRVRGKLDLGKLTEGARGQERPELGYFFGLASKLGPYRGYDRAVAKLRGRARSVRRSADAPLLLYQFVWNPAVGIAGSFFGLFMLRELEVGFAVLALHETVTSLSRMLAAPLWGRLIDRVGVRRVLVICSFGIAAVPLVWLLPTPSRLWPLAVDAVLAGVLWSGHGIAAFTLPLDVTPRLGRPAYLAVLSTTGGLAFSVGTVCGGRSAGRSPARSTSLFGQVHPANDDPGADLLLEAQDCIDARAYAEADELLHKVLALDLRHLDAHAMLGERNLSSWPTLALHHFELGVAIGSLTVGEDFDGVLPWGFVENRPFLRCLHGLPRAHLRCLRPSKRASS